MELLGRAVSLFVEASQTGRCSLRTEGLECFARRYFLSEDGVAGQGGACRYWCRSGLLL